MSSKASRLQSARPGTVRELAGYMRPSCSRSVILTDLPGMRAERPGL